MPYLSVVLPIVAFIMIVGLESLHPLFTGRAERWLHAGRHFLLFIFNTAVLYILFSILTFKTMVWYQVRAWGLANRLSLPRWISIIVLILLFDLWMYVWHRMNHEVPFFWRFHRMHHSDPSMDVSTALRFHTGELVMSSVLRLGVFILLGLDAAALFIYEIIMKPVIYFHHSNFYLSGKVDRVLRHMIVTPWMHWVHHSHIQPETDSNYGTIFSWWDRLFGTFRLRKDPGMIIFGLDEFEDKKWQTLWGMLRTPLASSKQKM